MDWFVNPATLVAAADWAWAAGVAGLVTAIGAAIVAFRKAGPESSQILVDAASDVVVIQREWIEKAEARAGAAEAKLDEAMEKLRELQRQIHEMKTLESEVSHMRGQINRRDARIAALEKENRKLRERVAHLENGTQSGEGV